LLLLLYVFLLYNVRPICEFKIYTNIMPKKKNRSELLRILFGSHTHPHARAYTFAKTEYIRTQIKDKHARCRRSKRKSFQTFRLQNPKWIDPQPTRSDLRRCGSETAKRTVSRNRPHYENAHRETQLIRMKYPFRFPLLLLWRAGTSKLSFEICPQSSFRHANFNSA